MVTRILFDPRRDVPDGTTGSSAVTVTATPTGIAENGSIVVLPTSLTFSITTAADVLQLAPTTASWKWRLVVRDAVTNVVLQQRTVLVPDQASIAWSDLPDVEPASLQPGITAARNWDATFGQILSLISTLTTATTAQISAALAQVIGAAPATLDTLVELATAIGNDPNFAVDTATALAGKATPGQISSAITALSLGSASTHAASDFDAAGAAAAVAAAASATYLPLPTGTKSTGTIPVVQSNGSLAWAPIPALTGISVDTDGVPYYNPSGVTPIAMDTDGVPYVAA